MGTSSGIALPRTGIGNLRIWVPTYIIQSCNLRVGGSRFRFPANPKRKKLWLEALHLNQEYITVKDPRVCEKHFKPSDFKSNL